jgi:hypothetical protein
MDAGSWKINNQQSSFINRQFFRGRNGYNMAGSARALACCFRRPRRKPSAFTVHGRTRMSSARAPKTTREGACAPQCETRGWLATSHFSLGTFSSFLPLLTAHCSLFSPRCRPWSDRVETRKPWGGFMNYRKSIRWRRGCHGERRLDADSFSLDS